MKKMMQFIYMIVLAVAVIAFFMFLSGLGFVKFNSLIFWRNLSCVLILAIIIKIMFKALNQFDY